MAHSRQAILVLRAARGDTPAAIANTAEAAVGVPIASSFAGGRAAVAVSRTGNGQANAADTASIIGGAGGLVFAQAAGVLLALPRHAPSLETSAGSVALAVERASLRSAYALDARFFGRARTNEVVAAARSLCRLRLAALRPAALRCAGQPEGERQHECNWKGGQNTGASPAPRDGLHGAGTLPEVAHSAQRGLLRSARILM
jgi:hypothetical protein